MEKRNTSCFPVTVVSSSAHVLEDWQKVEWWNSTTSAVGGKGAAAAVSFYPSATNHSQSNKLKYPFIQHISHYWCIYGDKPLSIILQGCMLYLLASAKFLLFLTRSFGMTAEIFSGWGCSMKCNSRPQFSAKIFLIDLLRVWAPAPMQGDFWEHQLTLWIPKVFTTVYLMNKSWRTTALTLTQHCWDYQSISF